MAPVRKSVLITGCSAGGIGAALAEGFSEKGYHVFATARNPSKISPALASAPGVTPLTLDVLSPESIAAAVESVKRETGGRLDVLVNNSGGGYCAPALDASIEAGRRLYDLNVWAPLAMLQAFAPLLISARGCVVNNTSANAYCPMPLMSIYNGSKAAFASASETWRYELQPLGVRTITLITTGVKTNFFSDPPVVEIPETSSYYPIRDFIHGLNDGRLQANAISARQYAAKVVREVEKGSAGPVWAGTDAQMSRFGVWLSPQWLFDKLIGSIVPFASEMAKAQHKKRA